MTWAAVCIRPDFQRLAQAPAATSGLTGSAGCFKTLLSPKSHLFSLLDSNMTSEQSRDPKAGTGVRECCSPGCPTQTEKEGHTGHSRWSLRAKVPCSWGQRRGHPRGVRWTLLELGPPPALSPPSKPEQRQDEHPPHQEAPYNKSRCL